MTEDIKTELRNFIVANFLFGHGERLSDEQSLLDGGFIDSTGVLELVSHIEEKYGIELADQELIPENLDSVAAVAQFVQRKLAGVALPAGAAFAAACDLRP